MKRYEIKRSKKEEFLYIDKITKVFRNKNIEIVANDGITLEVKQGEILGILGPNGAGKTTLIKQIATLLIPDKGDIFYKGISIVKHPESFRGEFSFLMEGSRNLYEYLPGGINLLYFAYLHRIPTPQAVERKNRLLDLMGLKDFEHEYVLNYSSGMKKKLSIALCFMTEPSIVFLDEPLSGLDIIAAEELSEVIRDIVKDRNMTFIIASHRMDFIEKVTDRVVWLKDGKIVKIGDTVELKAYVEGCIYTVLLKDTKDVMETLKKEGVNYKRMGNNLIECTVLQSEKGLLKLLVGLDGFVSVEKRERDFEILFKEVYK